MKPKGPNLGVQQIKAVADEVFSSVGTAEMRRRLSLAMVVQRAWTQTIGATAAANVTVVGLRPDGTLVVQATTASWMHEFSCLKHEVLKRLWLLPGGTFIKNVVVKAMSRHRTQHSTESAPTLPEPGRSLTEDEIRRVAEAVGRLTDPELQRAIKRVFERSLVVERDVNRRKAP